MNSHYNNLTIYSKCGTNSIILSPRYLRQMPFLKRRLKMFQRAHEFKKSEKKIKDSNSKH